MTARTVAEGPALTEADHVLYSLAGAVLTALAILRSDRAAAIESHQMYATNGMDDLTSLDEVLRPRIAAYDRSIALCEEALQKVGLR